MQNMIKVLVIDNNNVDLQIFENIFKNNNLFEYTGIRVSGIEDASKKNITREEHKNNLIKTINKNDFDILIMDIFFRNNEEYYDDNDFPNLLSKEVIEDYISKNGNNLQKMILFSSSHNKCDNEYKYRKLKDNDVFFKDYEFIRKPIENVNRRYNNCIYSYYNEFKCGDTFKNKCTEKDCYLKVLKFLYDKHTSKREK